MTPKEKAQELIEKFEPYCYHERIECSLISVNLLITYMPEKLYRGDDTTIYDNEYWQEVKQEIKRYERRN